MRWPRDDALGGPTTFFGVYYGDTVPANGFQAAGMTFEKYGGDKIAVRTREQFVAQWTSISNAAIQKERILNEWHQAWVGALAQGQARQLEPNTVVNPKNAIEQTVPAGPVRNYFIRADDPAKASEVQSLVRRLQRMEPPRSASPPSGPRISSSRASRATRTSWAGRPPSRTSP